MRRDSGLVLPTVTSYSISVAVGAIPKLFVIILAIVIAAFRAELFFSLFNDNGDLPVEICLYSEDNGDYRGDRICNNGLANAIVSILVAMALMMIDLIIPCFTVTSFTKVAYIFTILWAGLMAVYWCITGSLLADLYSRSSEEEYDQRQKFLIFPIFSFLCMAAWIGIGVISLLRMLAKRSE